MDTNLKSVTLKKITLLFLLIPFINYSQIQIGQDIFGETEQDRSGWSINLSGDGNVLAISSIFNSNIGPNTGHVRVFENISGTWTQIGNAIQGSEAGEFYGTSVSLNIDGSTMVIGTRGYDDPTLGGAIGYAQVFQNISGTWTQIGNDIIGEAAGNQLGKAVSISNNGTIVALGAFKNSNANGNLSGHVRVFENIAGTWTQIGQDIDGEAASDLSGSGVSLNADGTTVAIGARGNDDNGNLSGHVRVFENIAGTWSQVGQDIDGEAEGDYAGGTLNVLPGNSVSISANGNIIAVGATKNDGNGTDSGHVRVFENIAGTWTQINQDIDGEFSGDNFGSSVSLSANGNVLAIGAPFNSSGGNTSAGHVRIYQNISGTWIQTGLDLDGVSPGDVFGNSLSLSDDGRTLAVSANQNDNVNGANAGTVSVYDISMLLSTEDYIKLNFNLFPNPTKNQFTIQLDDTSILEEVTIYNTLGQVVLTSEDKIVDTSKLASGSYIVEIQTTQGKASKKLIID